MVANPVDEHGHKIIGHIYRMCNHQRAIFMQPSYLILYLKTLNTRTSRIPIVDPAILN